MSRPPGNDNVIRLADGLQAQIKATMRQTYALGRVAGLNQALADIVAYSERRKGEETALIIAIACKDAAERLLAEIQRPLTEADYPEHLR